MSIVEFNIPATSWQSLDGSTNNTPPAGITIPGTTTQKKQIPVWAFDGGGAAEYLCYTTTVPLDYVTGGTLKISWTVNSTSAANVVWQARVMSVNLSSIDTPFEFIWDTASAISSAVDTAEARRVIEVSLDLYMGLPVVSRDMLSILLFRDSAHASDTCTADAEFHGAAFQYQARDSYIAPPWIPMAGTYQNSWVDSRVAEGLVQPGQYRKIGNDVEIRGIIKNGTNNTACFTLPAGYQPAEAHLWGIDRAALAHGRFDAHTNNTLIPNVSTGTAYVALNTELFWSTAANGLDGWIAVSGGVGFTNSWTNYGSGWTTAAYRKKGDIVEIRGLVASGTIGTSIFTLPIGYRPTHEYEFQNDNATGFGQIGVLPNGTVVAGSGNNGYYGLFSIRFSTSAPGTNGWTALTLESGWSNYNSSTHIPAEYRVLDDMVEVRGLVAGGANEITFLPLNAQPVHLLTCAAIATNTHGVLDVYPDGSITHISGTATYVSLSEIRFSKLP